MSFLHRVQAQMATRFCEGYFAAFGGEIEGCWVACFFIFFRKNQKTGTQQNIFLFEGSSMVFLHKPLE